ncbi:sigma factor-like helix-turn-helix DNA-binding protein [Thiotrichales bacterium HSG1]|nr:sigma factor-like helix-turn-helix DNA-binding protein [Thiotrichales bacterium HSG1]
MSSNFYEDLMQVITNLSKRRQRVILKRLGFDGKRNSLESIGKELSITRERVRQIEVDCLGDIRKACGFKLNYKLEKLLIHREKALYISGLEVEDNWFLGFLKHQLFLAQTVKKLTNYDVVTINGHDIITKINKNQWNEIKINALEKLKSQITKRKLSKKEVEKILRQVAATYQTENLTDLLYESIEKQLYFASPCGKGQKILCSIGNGIASFLTALLFEANEPLHYTEIAQKCSDMIGHDVKGYVHNNLKGLAYLYGRGIYGTMEHFPLSEVDRKKILAITEKIILAGPPERQWSCNELYQKLQSYNFNKKLDKYLVNIILTKSKVLKSVGRLMWIKKTTDLLRLDLQETVFTIVKQAGKPISADEIKQLLIKQRGIDRFLTVLPTVNMVRVRPNVWGLIERDFPLTEVERLKILDIFYKNLLEQQAGLHITELKYLLIVKKVNLPDNVTDYMLLSLTQADSRFVIRRGQLLGLLVWNDAKRISIREAVAQLTTKVKKPTTILNIRKSVEKIVGHKVNQPLNKLLRDNGFVRDKSSKTWSMIRSK